MKKLNLEHTVNIIPDVKRRTLKRLDYLKLHGFGLLDLHNRMIQENINNTFDAEHNSQIMSLEHLLNTKLSPVIDIYIIDGNWIDESFIFIDDEKFSDELYLYTDAEALTDTYLYTEIEFDDQMIDYYVILSVVDSALEDKLKNLLDTRGPAGKKYEITIT